MQQPHTQAEGALEASLNAYMVTASLVAAHQLGLFSALAERPRNLSDLALSRGVEREDRLIPLLTFLEEYGFLQHSDGVFSLTELATKVADCEKPYGGMLDLIADQYVPAFFNLGPSIRSDKTGFEIAHGQSVWTERCAKPERGKAFQRWLDLETRGLAEEIARQFDWGRYLSVVDLGGGWGALARAIKCRFPQVQVALFESPQVCTTLPERRSSISQAENTGQVSKESCTDAIDEVIPGDLFSELPNAYQAYILKSVLHDWSDLDCQKLLSKLASQLGYGQRVIVIERCLDTAEATESLRVEDDALEARRAIVNLSLTMFAIHGARERSQPEWQELFQRAGLCLDQQKKLESGLVIFELKPYDPRESGFNDNLRQI